MGGRRPPRKRRSCGPPFTGIGLSAWCLSITDTRLSTSLKVTHLHQPVFDGMSGIMQATRIPTQLEYNDVVMKDAGLVATTPSGEDDSTITPSTIVASELGPVNGGGMETPAATSQPRTTIGQSPTMVSENGDTQTSNVPRMKSALSGFMLPERLTQVCLFLL